MIQIVQLHGTDKKLYELVAPLVMSPEVLKQNYNYPFRTSEEDCYRRFIQMYSDVVMELGKSFFEERIDAMKERKGVKQDVELDANDLKELVKEFKQIYLEKQGEESSLTAVSFVEDRDVFSELGFLEDKVWTRYVKMKKNR